MKEIVIQYEDDDVNVQFDPDDIQEALGVLLMTFRGLLHSVCKGDKELLYLSILEATQSLRTEPNTNFPQEVEVGKEKEEAKTEV